MHAQSAKVNPFSTVVFKALVTGFSLPGNEKPQTIDHALRYLKLNERSFIWEIQCGNDIILASTRKLDICLKMEYNLDADTCIQLYEIKIVMMHIRRQLWRRKVGKCVCCYFRVCTDVCGFPTHQQEHLPPVPSILPWLPQHMCASNALIVSCRLLILYS